MSFIGSDCNELLKKTLNSIGQKQGMRNEVLGRGKNNLFSDLSGSDVEPTENYQELYHMYT